jgi:hypothetical protein
MLMCRQFNGQQKKKIVLAQEAKNIELIYISFQVTFLQFQNWFNH